MNRSVGASVHVDDLQIDESAGNGADNKEHRIHLKKSEDIIDHHR